MKKKVFIPSFIIGLMIIASSSYLYPVCYYNHYITPDSCARNAWEGENGGGCPQPGTTCEVLCDETPYLAGTISLVQGGKLLTGHLTNNSISLHITFDQTDTTITRSNNQYSFGFNERIRIVECPEYPELENVDVSLEGIVTNQNGYFNVFIPIP
jgi:hypothetical protein